MFKLIPSKLPGCFEIEFNQLLDQRGWFTKTFHKDVFKELDINLPNAEEYFSYSIKHVFRGLHFQLPPKDLDKLVYCVHGKVIDYVVDLRIGSPSYGEWASFELDGARPKAIFIPTGFAHGFYVTSENAIMNYKVSETYDAACDTGISYTSFSFAKDIIDPIVSEKDSKLIALKDFTNPFKFK